MALDYQELKKVFTAEFQLDKIPEERREEVLTKMGEALFKRIFLATMEKIGDEGVRQYEGLLEKEVSAEEVEAFFEAKISGYNEFVEKIVEEFKAEMKKAEL